MPPFTNEITPEFKTIMNSHTGQSAKLKICLASSSSGNKVTKKINKNNFINSGQLVGKKGLNSDNQANIIENPVNLKVFIFATFNIRPSLLIKKTPRLFYHLKSRLPSKNNAMNHNDRKG